MFHLHTLIYLTLYLAFDEVPSSAVKAPQGDTKTPTPRNFSSPPKLIPRARRPGSCSFLNNISVGIGIFSRANANFQDPDVFDITITVPSRNPTSSNDVYAFTSIIISCLRYFRRGQDTFGASSVITSKPFQWGQWANPTIRSFHAPVQYLQKTFKLEGTRMIDLVDAWRLVQEDVGLENAEKGPWTAVSLRCV